MQSASHVLVELLLELFGDAAEIRRFIRSRTATEGIVQELPNDTVSAKAMADALVARLAAHGLVDTQLFDALVEIRPLREGAIRSVAARWNSASQPPKRRTASRSLYLALALALGIILVSFIAYVLATTETAAPIAQRDGEAPVENGTEQVVLPTHNTRASLDVVPALVMPDEVISLTSNEADPITLRLVSRRAGTAWRVAVSRHREASAAAEAMFYKLLVASAPAPAELRTYLKGAEFSLCDKGACFQHAIVGDAFIPDTDVQIRFGFREAQMTIASGRPRPAVPETLSAMEEWVPRFPGSEGGSGPDIDRAGVWAEELANGDPWVVVATSALMGAGKSARGKRRSKTKLRFKIAVCPNGSIARVEQVQGTGEAKSDATILRALASVTFPTPYATRARKLDGCPMLPHTFTLE